MNLDDYDKIPCSAKEAWRWMETFGNYCQQERFDTSIVRIGANRRFEDKFIDEPDEAWSVYNTPGLLAYDWYKLVPKKKKDYAVDTAKLALLDEQQRRVALEIEKAERDRTKNIDVMRAWEAIDVLCSNIAWNSNTNNRSTLTLLLRDFARAIVKVIEEKK